MYVYAGTDHEVADHGYGQGICRLGVRISAKLDHFILCG